MNSCPGIIKTYHVMETSIEEWSPLWACIPHANLLQSWQYGAAKEQAEGWRARRFLIAEEATGRPVALAQWLTRTLPFLGGIARLNRGPLLLEALPEKAAIETSLGVLQALFGEARRQRWWIVQVAPELPDHETSQQGLRQLGLRRQAIAAWASGRLDLRADEPSLLMGLKAKWRNCMRKGTRDGVVVAHQQGNNSYQDQLIHSYANLQRSRGFKGLSEELIRQLAEQQGQAWSLDLFVARDSNTSIDDEPIGFLVSTRHGDTATYLIGSTNDKGRQMQANSNLLWQAILHAKRNGCAWFDVGGLSTVTPKGVADFKQGLNATPYELVGEWRGYYFPI